MLKKYLQKRSFRRTPEPKGGKVKSRRDKLHFVVHKHKATRLHYDLRLESEGVLKSWAVPKGMPKPGEKRLAVMVEDHPFEYKDFEGIIPPGNYGAGTVMIWDKGFYFLVKREKGVKDSFLSERRRYRNNLYYPKNKDLIEGIGKGEFTFVLKGEKLDSEFSLIKFDKGGENSWLLISRTDDSKKYDDSVSALSGKTMEEIAEINNPDLKNIKGAIKSEMPEFVKPMLASLISEPFDKKEWIFEIKWDGYRVISRKENDEVILLSRNKKVFNAMFLPILESLKKIPMDFFIDGEVIVADKNGKTNFQLLQNYLTKREGRLIYYVFDIIFLNSYDLKKVPLLVRKKILENFLPKLDNVKLSEHIGEKGRKLFEIAREKGMEGIIGKNGSSYYRDGIRSDDWLKIKAIKTQEAVIGGFTEPRGGRKKFGALVLGVFEGPELVYIGHTGGGFGEEDLSLIMSKLKPLIISKSPFKKIPKTNAPVTWVKPELVIQVKFSEWTSEGLMRQPVFLGLREDKKASEVAKENSSKEDAKVYSTQKKGTEEIISGEKVRLTNLKKVFWPEEGYTKGDLVEYYRKIAKIMLPYLKDRPESLNRFPDGIYGESFFQKDMKEVPDWVKTEKIPSDSEGRIVQYMLCQDEVSLIYMANLASIEINPWNSRIENLDYPDYMVLDLDPLNTSFVNVVKVAQETKKLLDKIRVKSFCKTSGATGLHIYIPLSAKYDYDQVREFARLINFAINRKLPQITSIQRSPSKRSRKVYLDFLQNSRGQTLVAPYSVRPRPGAPVSTPLDWREVNEKLDPAKFNIKTIFDRVETKGDIWKGVLGKGIDIGKAVRMLEDII